MLRSKVAWLGLRRAPSCACLATVLLLHLTGCDSPTRAPAAGKGAAAREKTAPVEADAPAKTDAKVADAPPEKPNPSGEGPTEQSSVPSIAPADPAGKKRDGAKLSGRILFQGTPPTRRVVNTTKDPMCVGLHADKQFLDEDLLVSSAGGVRNAFIRVHRGAPKQDYPMPEKPAELHQKGCMFEPRVQGVRVGQKLLVGNGDPMTHNVRTFTTANAPFNFGQPPDTPPRERVFERAEREVEVACDFHPWMHAYIFVMEHPFFSVSAEDGAYAIEGLPPGEYVLECWHEKLGKQRKTVTVADKDLADVDFTLAK